MDRNQQINELHATKTGGKAKIGRMEYTVIYRRFCKATNLQHISYRDADGMEYHKTFTGRIKATRK